MNPATESFIQEARELLQGLEAMLLELETASDPEQIDAVFRALHTVKGSSGMFGFGALSRFTHHFENAFDQVREGRLAPDRRLIDLSLAARDHMLALLETGGDGPQAEQLEQAPQALALIAALGTLTAAIPTGDTPAHAGAPTAAPKPAAVERQMRLFDIWFKPNPDALHNGMRPDLLIEELRGLGHVDLTIDAEALPPLASLDPGQSYLGFKLALLTDHPRSAIESVFIFADDAELRIVENLASLPASDPNLPAPPRAGTPAPEGPTEAKPRKSNDTSGESVRVPAARLDEMMDQLGELVIAYARLEQIASRISDPLLESVVEEVERLVTGLRDATLSIRMLPIEIVFGKFRRVVRDLSSELGKNVTLLTEGGETEIDKNVIDRLTEPLVHMIRNSIDHGIETAADRAQSGKPAEAKVRLSARQAGGEVLISIEDDGAGINLEAVRAKGIKQGLISADKEYTSSELHSLIFAPGFSTAASLSSVSGRGVGMDAVRSAVDALRGSIDLVSRPGRGTRVTLRLPVTLAIIDGLLVRLGDAKFVIPLSAVEECVEFDEADRQRESGRTMLQIREHLVPFLDLNTVFRQNPSGEIRRRVVIVRADGARIGLVVDDILGQNQTVIKPLSVYHKSIQGFAGATILGDGAVALIIDVGTMVKQSNLIERRFHARRSGDQQSAA